MRARLPLASAARAASLLAILLAALAATNSSALADLGPNRLNTPWDQLFQNRFHSAKQHADRYMDVMETQGRQLWMEFDEKLKQLQQHARQAHIDPITMQRQHMQFSSVPPQLPDSDFPTPTSFVELGSSSKMPYPYESALWDNPGTDLQPTPIIPSSPQCTIRPQTVEEIQKMRMDASEIGRAIEWENQIMAIRKGFVERFSAYINDRIRELNKVKADLTQEQKWVQISSQRIGELAQKEKLIKLEDVMACIMRDQNNIQAERSVKDKSIKDMKFKADALMKKIKDIRTHISQINMGTAGQPEKQ